MVPQGMSYAKVRGSHSILYIKLTLILDCYSTRGIWSLLFVCRRVHLLRMSSSSSHIIFYLPPIQFFATSKDVSIGPVAVMCLEVANIISHITDVYGDRWGPVQIAVTLSFICGFIVLAVGLLRIGWIVEFIPTPAVAGFMTGSAITIASQQVPGLLGIGTLFDTRASAYLVIINTLKNLKYCNKDAAFGITGLFSAFSSSLASLIFLCPYYSALLHSMVL